MLEQEIKLYVPAASRKAIAAELSAQSAQRRVRLRAMYFDTDDRQLARQRAAVRLRQEGRKWVQTFKMAGHDALSRVELNHPAAGPTLDLSVYVGTPAQALFEGLDRPLGVRYETDVMRAARKLRTRGGVAEVAYDVGTIRAGGLEVPVHEVEFELMSGKPDALFTLARRWMRAHSLVLDMRSKAERGDGLARAAIRIAAVPDDEKAGTRDDEIARFWRPAFARPVALDPHMSPERALDVVTAECLDQIIRNAAVLADVDKSCGPCAGGAEHIHQLRVGMRRLRSAWRLFKQWTPLPGDALREAAARHFADFGKLRDQDVLGGTLMPALLAAGMPKVELATAGESADAAVFAGAPAFQIWLLDLLAWNVARRPAAESVDGDAPLVIGGAEMPGARVGEAGMPKPRKLSSLAARRLRKWHRRLVADGGRFHELLDEQRHDLRKLAKRLRYALSFTESLYRGRLVRPYRKRLAALQDVLGDINDLVVARQHYAGLTGTYPQAWFALGWIAARLDELYAQAEAGFAALADTRPFWRK